MDQDIEALDNVVRLPVRRSRPVCDECESFYSGIRTWKHDLELGCSPTCPCGHDHRPGPDTTTVNWSDA